jgi:hypothetical protein
LDENISKIPMNREKEVFSDEKQIFNNDFFQKALK